MRNEDFLDFLRYIKLPRGILLGDGTTYRLKKQDFPPLQFATPGGRRCVGERPFCIESGRHR